MLTGKCKIDFEKWHNNSDLFDDYYIAYVPAKGMLDDYKIIEFKDMPFNMQYGVYVDFFDSFGIFCEDRRYTDINMAWVVKHPNFDGLQDRFDGLVKTRPEARKKAIEKANEIYNNKTTN